MRLQVWSLALLSGLTIRHCRELRCRSQTRLGSRVAVVLEQAGGYSSDSTPSLGTQAQEKAKRQTPKQYRVSVSFKKNKKLKTELPYYPALPLLGFFFFFFFFLSFSKAAPAAYGGSPARGLISAVSPGRRPMPEPQQWGIQATSVTHTTAHGNTRSLTHWERPGVEPTTSWFLAGFINHWTTTRTPHSWALIQKATCTPTFLAIHSTIYNS